MDSPGRSGAETLLDDARNGRAESLGSLLELYRNYLYLLARTQIDRHLQGRVDPSDLVQETFLLACAKFDQFRGQSEGEFLGWLRRILVNCLASMVEKQVLAKKRDVRQEVSLQEHAETLERSAADFEAALACSQVSPSLQAQRRELAAFVADQLAKLPPDYRDVIVLRNLEFLSFNEVARRMGRSPGAARMLWLRALDQLQQLHDWEDLA